MFKFPCTLGNIWVPLEDSVGNIQFLGLLNELLVPCTLITTIHNFKGLHVKKTRIVLHLRWTQHWACMLWLGWAGLGGATHPLPEPRKVPYRLNLS